MEEEEEEGKVISLDLVVTVIVILRLMESEEGVEGSMAVGLMAAVCLVEGGVNVSDLIGRYLVELVALVHLCPAKVAVEEMLLEVEVEVRGTRRMRVVRGVGGMLMAGRAIEVWQRND